MFVCVCVCVPAPGGGGAETQPLPGVQLRRSPEPDLLRQLRLVHRTPPLAPQRSQGTHKRLVLPMIYMAVDDVSNARTKYAKRFERYWEALHKSAIYYSRMAYITICSA